MKDIKLVFGTTLPFTNKERDKSFDAPAAQRNSMIIKIVVLLIWLIAFICASMEVTKAIIVTIICTQILFSLGRFLWLLLKHKTFEVWSYTGIFIGIILFFVIDKWLFI